MQAACLLWFPWILYLSISALNLELGWASTMATSTEQVGEQSRNNSSKNEDRQYQKVETTQASINE